MSAPMRNHARIRLYFDNLSIEPSWMFVDHTKTKTISSIEDKIRENYSKQVDDIELTLLGCRLPAWESSCLLHDEDIVHVRAVNSSNTRPKIKDCVVLKQKDKYKSEHEEEIADEQKRKHKKKKKQKDKSSYKTDSDIQTEENNEIKAKNKKKHKEKIKNVNKEEVGTITTSPLDGEKSQKEFKKHKRKQDDSEISSNIAEKRPKSEKEFKDMSDDFISLEVEKKIESEPTKDNGDKSNNALDICSHSNDNNQDGKKKRKRKRTRKRKNGSDVDLTLAKEQSLYLADTLLQTSRNENFKSLGNDSMFSLKQRGKYFTPSNNYKKFESDEENEVENSMSASLFVCTESDNSQTKIEETHSVQNGRPYSNDYDTKSLNSSIQESGNTVFPMETCDNISTYNEQEIPRESLQCTTATLANGVTVYSRPRNRRERRFQQRELSKEEQLNTKLTNISYIYRNEDCKSQTEDTNGIEPDYPDSGDINNCINVQDCEIVPLFKDYSRFPLLKGVPSQGDTIAYKVIEMSDMYTPEISDYKEAVVCNFDTKSQLIELEIKHQKKGKKELGKFDVTLEDEESIITTEQDPLDKVCLSWSSLMETRLLTK